MTEKATRRKFSAEYKLRILAEAEGSTERGQIGALLRREGLYASTLDKWRKQRVRGTLGGEKRGPKVDAQAEEWRRLQQQLWRAENIIEIQKKLAVLLGAELNTADEVDQPEGTSPKNKPRRSD